MARRITASLASAVVVVLALVSAAAALHEDQAGDHDWVRPGIGHAHLAAFPPTIGKASKPVHVATRRNVVASFSTVRGSLRWRHVLGTKDNITCLAAADQLVLVGTDSGLLLALDAHSGKVKRSLPVATADMPDAKVVGCTAVDGGNVFAALVASSADETATAATVVTIPANNANALPNALDGKKHTRAVDLAVAGVRSATFVERAKALILLATTTDGDAIVINANADGAKATVDTTHRDALKWGTFAAGSAAATTTVHTCGGGATVALSDDSSKVASVAKLATDRVVIANGITAPVTEQGFLQLAGEPTGLRERVGNAPKVLASRTNAKSGTSEALVASSSGALQYLKLKGADSPAGSWIVEGGLGDVHAVVFPKQRGDLLLASDSIPGTREHKFGLKDRFIALSRFGALFSLRTADGANATEWGAFPAGDATIHFPETRSRCYSVRSLSTSADGQLVVVRLQFRATDKYKSALVVQLSYDVFTGLLVSQNTAPADAAAVFLGDGSVVATSGKVTGDAIEKPRDYHVVDKAAGVVTGYSIAEGTTEAAESWRVELGAPLAAFASGAADPRLVSSVEHLRYIPNATSGAKDIRRKYPTANVLVAAHFSESADEEGVKTLTVTALDAVTGQVLASMRHHDVDGDVAVAIVEHVVIYHFLNVDAMRYMVGAWELFESQDAHLVDNQYTSPAMVVMSFLDKRRRFSALATRPPAVSPQLLAFPHGAVAAIGATTSMQGIARKQLVFALAEGSVITVPLSMFVAGGIPEVAPQGAAKPPPKATILVPSTQFITHNNRALRASVVTTAPTPLESTTHVVVAGLDLFYARASSGKPFDIIDDEFNRVALTAGCVVLPIVTLVLRFVAQRRALSVAWA